MVGHELRPLCRLIDGREPALGRTVLTGGREVSTDDVLAGGFAYRFRGHVDGVGAGSVDQFVLFRSVCL